MRQSNGSRDLSEAFQDFLTACARIVLGLGTLATLVAVGILVFNCFRVTSGDGQALVQSAIDNVNVFEKILYAGLLGLAVGSTYLFWGEEVLGVFQLLGAAALFFAPIYIPMIISGGDTNDAVRAALGALQRGGTLLGGISICVLVIDLVIRVQSRAKKGAKSDQMKFGKGIKEENDRQNVLMGKCWQLPYCRKFVRERCPIFHAQRTCWKERVGCMCEEEVIRNAMENKPIPKESLLSPNMIPRNNRLTDAQKFERCKNCTIYNEHQRHKYRVGLPFTLVFFVAIYGLLHGPLISATGAIVNSITKGVNQATITNNNFQAPTVFVEGLLAVFFVVAISYALKMLEVVLFKLKL